ncbi:hypothetical protein INR49_017073 [Caranx melampygus]|nr:hypothetical protein INR49_017073 [Caranx melampygus]
MAETKIIYHIDEEETPYLVKLSVSPEKVTLADFKNVLNNRPLVLAESAHSDGGSQCTESHPELPPPLERTGGIGDSRPPSFHANAVSSRDGLDTETGTESLLSHRRERERERARRRARETELPLTFPTLHTSLTCEVYGHRLFSHFCSHTPPLVQGLNPCQRTLVFCEISQEILFQPLLRFKPCHLQSTWKRNCHALGLKKKKPLRTVIKHICFVVLAFDWNTFY